MWCAAILLHLINERISAYNLKQIYNWERAVKTIEGLCAATELDLKLPKGWNEPPVHQTESNCWVCGRFTANDHITKIDEGKGWQAAADGAVTCFGACRAKAALNKKLSPNQTTKKATKKK